MLPLDSDTAMHHVKMLKCNSDYSVQNDESLSGHCTNERKVRNWNKKVRRDVIKDDCRRGRERWQQ